MDFLHVFILQFLYNSTCFERPFRSSSGVHDLLYSAALYKPCKHVYLLGLQTEQVDMFAWFVQSCRIQ